MPTIVLVDDEPALALVYSLEARGFHCVTATDMTDGVKALQENEASALVTDIMMPPGEAFKKVDAQRLALTLSSMFRTIGPGYL